MGPSNCYDVSYSIPLMMRHPGVIPEAPTSQRFVGTTDMFETFLDHAGLKDAPRNADALVRPHLAWRRSGMGRRGLHGAGRNPRHPDPKWLYMHRFQGSGHDFKDEFYDLEADPGEYHNLAAEPSKKDVIAEPRTRLEAFFDRHADPHFDLWKGGSVKSNSSRPWLWKEAWSEDWTPVCR